MEVAIPISLYSQTCHQKVNKMYNEKDLVQPSLE